MVLPIKMESQPFQLGGVVVGGLALVNMGQRHHSYWSAVAFGPVTHLPEMIKLDTLGTTPDRRGGGNRHLPYYLRFTIETGAFQIKSDTFPSGKRMERPVIINIEARHLYCIIPCEDVRDVERRPEWAFRTVKQLEVGDYVVCFGTLIVDARPLAAVGRGRYRAMLNIGSIFTQKMFSEAALTASWANAGQSQSEFGALASIEPDDLFRNGDLSAEELEAQKQRAIEAYRAAYEDESDAELPQF